MSCPTHAGHRLRRIVVLAAAIGLTACGSPGLDPAGPGKPAQTKTLRGPFFTEQAATTGIDFNHFNGMSGELYFIENVGSGGALFDYDNDGDLDAYLVQGRMLGGKPVAKAVFPPKHPLPLTDHLYRNDLEIRPDGSRTLRFTNVTAESGIHAPGYGMGVAAADYDNDGWVDLYVSNFGSNQMWHNRGDGTFEEVVARAGTDDERWSTSSVFLDYDRDGWLDLFVSNYVDFSEATHRPCFGASSRQDYCGPKSYDPEPDRLFRNRGDGSFEDVSGPSGIFSEYGAGLGVVTTDFDGDGWLDVFVANDGMVNFLWMNQRDGTFRNRALLAGVAVNAMGEAEASMGVDAGDLDRDGDDDLFMTHLDAETNTLYINEGNGIFSDRTASSQLGAVSSSFTGFGTAFTDFDNDGWLDILVANGAVKTVEALALAGHIYPLHQVNLLFRNLGDATFANVSAEAGEVFELAEVSRGAAMGDVDQDGDTDALINNNTGPARLLINEVGQDNHWIGLRLYNERLRRDMTGTRAEIVMPDGTSRWRRARSGASYCSANDPRIIVGLGAVDAVDRVRVYWPDGHVERWDSLPTGQYSTLTQGTGTAVAEPRP